MFNARISAQYRLFYAKIWHDEIKWQLRILLKGEFMKKIIETTFFITLVLVSGQALAGADDDKWINKCISDNAKEGATADVVKKYCSCMNNKMSENETQSISTWEKTHQAEMKACEAEAGWK